MLFYLSGSIEYASDKGKSWRAELTPFLLSLGHGVYDPAADEKKNLADEEVRHFRSWKLSDLERFQTVIRKIIAWDLDWVEKKSDAVIALWDEAAQRGAGTGAELTMAHRHGVPVYMVAGMPRNQISGWILGCATHVFNDFSELRAFLSAMQANAVPYASAVEHANTSAAVTAAASANASAAVSAAASANASAAVSAAAHANASVPASAVASVNTVEDANAVTEATQECACCATRDPLASTRDALASARDSLVSARGSLASGRGS